MVQFRTMKKWGWAVFVVGLIFILSGIVARRVYHAGEYLIVLHIIGGICLVVGGMLVLHPGDARQ
ncbi:MAG TPA: hypothetical protein VGL91_09870 [Acidobacteriota bacterium]|jgi:hypothetical protein